MLVILNIFSIFTMLNYQIVNNELSYSPEANVIFSQSDFGIKPFVDGDNYFMNKFYVYLHLTPKGEPFYVGKGQKNRAETVRNRTEFWKKTVKKNKGFVINYLAFDLSEKEALELEEYYIALFGKRHNKTGCLVNFNDGGKTQAHGKHSKIIFQFDLNGNFIEKFLCVTDASKKLNCSDATIRGVLDSNHLTAKGFLFATVPSINYKYIGKLIKCKKTYVYDINGNYLAEYKSIKECGEKLNIDPVKIRGFLSTKERKTCAGYRFSSIKKEKLPSITPRIKNNGLSISLINLKTQQEIVCFSVIDASFILNINKHQIYDYIRGRGKKELIINDMKVTKTIWK